MMFATSVTALLIALVPRVALGSNLRSNIDVHVFQYATSVLPPTIDTTRRLDRSDDHSDDSADGNTTEGSYAYVGCFSDNMDSTVMEPGFVCGGTTVETCFSDCTERGASFMGLKHGYACSCGFGEEYEYTLNGAGTCETECFGGGSSICGGDDAFSLYSLGESSSEPVEPMSPSPVASTGLPSTGVPLTTASPTTTYTSGSTSSPTSSSTVMDMRDHGRRTRPPASSRPPAPSRSATRMPAATMPPRSSSPVASPTPSPVVSFNPDPTTPPVTPETPFPVSPETSSSPVTPETEPTPSPVAPVSPPTQPSPESSTPADMEELLQLHNEARCIHDAEPLTWSDAVASSAALHAKTLADDCGEFYHSESEDRNGYGENLFVCWGSETCYSAAGAMQGLYNEEVDGFSKVTEYGGHATQILWKSTEELGCVVSTCTTGGDAYTYLVCQYDPPGNYMGSYEEEVGLPTDDGSC